MLNKIIDYIPRDINIIPLSVAKAKYIKYAINELIIISSEIEITLVKSRYNDTVKYKDHLWI